MLAQQIEKGSQELEYLESVLDTVGRAESERELSQIREELCEQGYLRKPKGKQQKQQKLAPREYVSSDGFKIYVGRNNSQNVKLTMKTAAKTSISSPRSKTRRAWIISKRSAKPARAS